MKESWRDETLTKGEVYDILMQVAEDVDSLEGKILGRRLSHMLKMDLITEIIKNSARAVAGEDRLDGM